MLKNLIFNLYPINKLKKLLLSSCLLLFIGTAYGDTLRVSEGFEYVDLQGVASLSVKADNEKGAKEIATYLHEKFTPLTETGITFRATQEVYWLRFTLVNEDALTKELILKIENPRINEVQFFSVNGSKIDSSLLAGDHFPFHQRSILNRNYLQSIQLLPNEVKTIYVYLNKSSENIELYASLWSKREHEKYDSKEKLFLYLFFGFGFCISLFALIAAIFSTQVIIYYYAFYCTFALLNLFSFHGFGFQFIWYNHPWFTPGGSFMFGLFSLTSLIGLMRSFLKTNILIPKYDKVFKFFQWLPLVFTPILIFEAYLSAAARTFLVNFGNIYFPVNVVLLIGAPLLVYFRTRKLSSLIYLAGFLFYVGSFLFYFFSISGKINSNNWTQFSGLIGLAVDLTILLLLISRQVRQTYKENIHLREDLLQTQLNAANALLDGQMKERQRLSQDLHEGISIRMALLKIKLSQVFNPLNDDQNIIEEVSNISEEIRAFTHAIVPLDLKKKTLVDAIEDLIYDVEEQTNIAVHLDDTIFAKERISNDNKLTIYQITKELINNTLKHANATEIKIILKSLENKCALIFEDNGNGFDIQQIEKGIGLINIQNRTKLMQGQFDMQSNEKGSRFELLFPIYE